MLRKKIKDFFTRDKDKRSEEEKTEEKKIWEEDMLKLTFGPSNEKHKVSRNAQTYAVLTQGRSNSKPKTLHARLNASKSDRQIGITKDAFTPQPVNNKVSTEIPPRIKRF